IHVDTRQAYQDLSPRLTTALQTHKMVSFQSLTWGTGSLAGGANDFEDVVFEQHPALAALRKRLVRAGASPARMSGSGSALFGLFADRNAVRRAIEHVRGTTSFPFMLVSRV